MYLIYGRFMYQLKTCMANSTTFKRYISLSPYPESNATYFFRVRYETLNSNQSKECECVMEFPLSHFIILT